MPFHSHQESASELVSQREPVPLTREQLVFSRTRKSSRGSSSCRCSFCTGGASGPRFGSQNGRSRPSRKHGHSVSGAHFRVFSAGAGKRSGKPRKSKLKLLRFGVETGPGGPPKLPRSARGVRKWPPEGVRERTQKSANFREMEKSKKGRHFSFCGRVRRSCGGRREGKEG